MQHSNQVHLLKTILTASTWKMLSDALGSPSPIKSWQLPTQDISQSKELKDQGCCLDTLTSHICPSLAPLTLLSWARLLTFCLSP